MESSHARSGAEPGLDRVPATTDGPERGRPDHDPGRAPEPVRPAGQAGGTVRDRLGRVLRDLRVSVTDRCNFRCTYCMPAEVFGRDFAFMPRAELLTFEEIERIVRVGVGLGVRKVRLTGGEPLVRRDLPVLVAALSRIEGLEDLALTTNGAALARLAGPLRDAGLRRVTVSLDSLDDETFAAMNGVGFPVRRVLDGIAAAADAGLLPIKVNLVLRRGVNETSLLPMARYCREHGLVLRVIEYMDVGTANGWRMEDVVPAADVVARIDAELPLEAVPPQYPGEVATRFRYRDGSGEMGVIASVTQPFCGACTRSRLTAEGQLFTCLFGSRGTDLRAVVRGGATDEELEATWLRAWAARADRYSELRSAATAELPRVEMFAIGG